MAIIWKINSQTFAELGLKNPHLTIVNRAVDRITFEHPAAFDGTALFAHGDEVVLTSQVDAGTPTVRFRGTIREIPRRGVRQAERITYSANGPWELLERRALLQTFKQASDPDNPSSTLIDVDRGQVILGQDDTGVKVNVGTAITAIIEYAAAQGANVAVGTISLSQNLIWSQVNDRSCADAINYLLSMAPDAVGWWDYSVNPPEFNCALRSSLTTTSLAVQPAGSADSSSYAPFEEIYINPRYDILCSRVALFYIATNRANASSWQVCTKDVYPVGTTGKEDNALVRTIELAGSVYSSTTLEQKIQTAAIPAELEISGTTIVTTGGTFDALVDWWKAHYPKLLETNVTIRSFRSGVRTNDAGDAYNEDCALELVDGAITDWMIDRQGVQVEDQIIRCRIEIAVEDPFDSSLVQVNFIDAQAVIKATSADKTSYSFIAVEDFTPAEEVPTDLAQALYNQLSVLHYDGSLILVEKEITFLAAVGQVINLTGSLTAWATMKALVQQVDYDLDRGRSQMTVGPARQLGPDDLVEMFRQNRNRQPVTYHLVRTTGRLGGTGSDFVQGLSRHHPVKPGTPSQPSDLLVLNGDI